MKDCIIAHDLGTSGNKATLFTLDGQLIKSVTHAYGVHFFNANWAEQNPDDWWTSFCACNKRLLDQVDASRIAAIAFSGQMMGCLCVDRQGRPLRPSIIWADMRADEQEKAIQAKISQNEFYHLTGHRISSSYGLEKLMWIRDNEPEIYRNTYKVLNAKDYIVSRLTGRYLTDYSDASGMNVLDINRFEWSEQLINLSGIDGEKLPEAVPSTTVAGEVSASIAKECGLPAGTKIVIGGGDGVCASVGAGSVSPGVTYCCLGSSSWVCTTAEHPVFDHEMRTFNWAHIVPGMISPCGTMQAAAASLNWIMDIVFKDERSVPASFDRTIDQAMLEVQSSDILAKNLIFLPYLLGERSPRWNRDARGAFIGLKMEHNRGDLLRSVIEGVAMNLRIILDVFRESIPCQELVIIGGMSNSNVIVEILADVFNLDIVKPRHVKEATSIGAAITAAVGIGAVKDFDVVSQFIGREGVQKPSPEHVLQYDRLLPIFDRAYRNLESLYESMARI